MNSIKWCHFVATTRSRLAGWRELARYILPAFLLFCVAAVFSTGFHHYDEHYHVLEYVALKAGKADPTLLPWEFKAQTRSWLLPAFFFRIGSGLEFVGLSDPLLAAQFFRFLGGVINVITLGALLMTGWTERLRIAGTLLTYLWFFPYVHVRTSSENWSGALFFLGLALPRTAKSVFFTGLLWMLGFQMRLQIGPMIAGAILWHVAFAREKCTLWFPFLVGACAALVTGLTIDRWGYGDWTLPWWNYFVDQFTHNRASFWGTAPPWYYITESIIKGVPPISIVPVGATLLSWYFFPKRLLTWVTLPFVLFHSIEPHKELRFMFPMLYATAFQVAWMVERFSDTPLVRILKRPWSVRLFWTINSILLVSAIVRPAESRTRLFSFLQNHYQSGTIRWVEDDPYTLFKMPLNFYRPPMLKTEPTTYEEVSQLIDSGKHIVLVSSRFELPVSAKMLRDTCRKVYGLLPLWMRNYDFNDWISRTRVWTVYECEKQKLCS